LRAMAGLARKGRVQVGCDADLIVFDAAQVTDCSTYDVPAMASVGFEHVLVAGEAVVRHGKVVTTAMTGRAIVGGAR